ncbi:MAG TPA: tetratricopeptide repeat protein [Candidatus Lokiarchaeia archaeon]|nr:tetratricopeptide repeat protein [Candidatus Lokiarchaeia archaeon]
MVFKLVGNGLKAPLVGAGAFNAIKNMQLRAKLAAKYEDIRDTHDDMISSFKANKPEKEKQGIDLFLQLSPLIKEYNLILKQLTDKAVQSKLAAVLVPIIENHGKIKEALDILASEDIPDAQQQKPVADTQIDQEPFAPKPSPVEISEQSEQPPKRTKPVAKPSFARLATKALAKAADASEWISQGKALMTSGEIESARTCFAKAVELAPWSADALFYHGSACFQTGDMQGAEKSLDAAVARYRKALEKPVLQDRPDIIKMMQANVVAAVDMIRKIANPAFGEESAEDMQEVKEIQGIIKKVYEDSASVESRQDDDIAESVETSSAFPEDNGHLSETSDVVNEDVETTAPAIVDDELQRPGEEAKERGTEHVNFACPGCGKFYRIKTPDVNLVYACSDCGMVLNRVFRCPRCKQAMALPQDQFKQIVNIEIPCVYCNEPFKA